jgi:hypothetical protein
LKCDSTGAETRFRLSAKRTSPFNPLNTKLNPICHLLALLGAHPILHVSKIRVKSAGGSVQSTTGRRGVHISLQAFHCSCEPVFCSHVTLTGYPLHSLVSPSLLHPCVTVCHHISNAVYKLQMFRRKNLLPSSSEANVCKSSICYMDLASGGRKLPRNVGVYQTTRRRTPEYLRVCMIAAYDSLRSPNVRVRV